MHLANLPSQSALFLIFLYTYCGGVLGTPPQARHKKGQSERGDLGADKSLGLEVLWRPAPALYRLGR